MSKNQDTKPLPLTAAQKLLQKHEEMGINKFTDSSGVWADIEVIRVDPVSFFELGTTPAVIAGLMQGQIDAKPPLEGEKPAEPAQPRKVEFEQTGELFRFCQDLWIKCCVSPKFVRTEDGSMNEAPEKNILSVNRVGIETLMEFLYFQIGGAGSVMVKTTGGDTTLRSVATFPTGE